MQEEVEGTASSYSGIRQRYAMLDGFFLGNRLLELTPCVFGMESNKNQKCPLKTL